MSSEVDTSRQARPRLEPWPNPFVTRPNRARGERADGGLRQSAARADRFDRYGPRTRQNRFAEFPSLTRSNRRGADLYARWCGRGGVARRPPISIMRRVGVWRGGVRLFELLRHPQSFPMGQDCPAARRHRHRRIVGPQTAGVDVLLPFEIASVDASIGRRSPYRGPPGRSAPRPIEASKTAIRNGCFTSIRDVRLLGTSVARRVELTRSKLHFRNGRSWRIPSVTGTERERAQRVDLTRSPSRRRTAGICAKRPFVMARQTSLHHRSNQTRNRHGWRCLAERKLRLRVRQYGERYLWFESISLHQEVHASGGGFPGSKILRHYKALAGPRTVCGGSRGLRRRHDDRAYSMRRMRLSRSRGFSALLCSSDGSRAEVHQLCGHPPEGSPHAAWPLAGDEGRALPQNCSRLRGLDHTRLLTRG